MGKCSTHPLIRHTFASVLAVPSRAHTYPSLPLLIIYINFTLNVLTVTTTGEQFWYRAPLTHHLITLTTLTLFVLSPGSDIAINLTRYSHSSLITLTTLFVLSSPSNLLITYINVLVVTITGEQFRYRASWQRYNDQYWLTCVYLLGR